MQVFLTHAHEDKPAVEAIGSWLYKNKGVRIWIDKWSMTAGDSLLEKIGEGIELSDRLVAFLSPASVESKWVKKEIATGEVMELAEEKGLGDKFVIPVLLKPVHKIPIMLRNKLYANFTNKPFEVACEELYRGIIDQPLGPEDVQFQNGFVRQHAVQPYSDKYAIAIEFGVQISPTEGFNGAVDLGVPSFKWRGAWFGRPNHPFQEQRPQGVMLVDMISKDEPPFFVESFSSPNITSSRSYYWWFESDEPFNIKETIFCNFDGTPV
jgi:hypothetical protein